jgi:hypothetical protein
MSEDIKTVCKSPCYDDREGYWTAYVKHSYHPELEVLISGNTDTINPALEKMAISTIKNIGKIEERVKAYIAQAELFSLNNGSATLRNPSLGNESAWYIVWLEFLDTKNVDACEAICLLKDDPELVYIYMLWIITLKKDIPVAHYFRCW